MCGPLAVYYHVIGDKEEADSALLKLIEEGSEPYSFNIAEVYGSRNEADKTFEWLERAYKQRDSGLPWVKNDPQLRSLERDPRWTAFLKKMKLPVD